MKLTQLEQVATLVPIARVFVGKTSDARTQLTGPKLREKKILSIKIMATPALKGNY
jgi:glycerol-3-phosphate O-acyltransferase